MPEDRDTKENTSEKASDVTKRGRRWEQIKDEQTNMTISKKNKALKEKKHSNYGRIS